MKPHKDAALFDGVPDQLIHDFAAVRKAKRAPITATAVAGIKREATKAGLTLEQALTICVERNWQGFNAQWVLRIADAGQPARQMVNDEAKRRLFGGYDEFGVIDEAR